MCYIQHNITDTVIEYCSVVGKCGMQDCRCGNGFLRGSTCVG